MKKLGITLATLYTIIYCIFSILSIILDGTIVHSEINSIINLCNSISILYGFGLCFSVALKKQLYSPKLLYSGATLSVITFLAMVIHEIITSRFEIYSLISISIGALILILLSIPMYVCFFVYCFKCKEYSKVDKPIHKLLTTQLLINSLMSLLLYVFYLSTGSLYNIYDYISIFAALFVNCLCVGYAYNFKILNTRILKTVIFCIILIGLIPIGLNSLDFIHDSKLQEMLSSYVGMTYFIIVNVYCIILILRYSLKKTNHGEEKTNVE